MAKSISPSKQVDGHKALQLDNYLSYFFAAIANRISRGASNLYLQEFGIGIVEWRCLVMLAIENGVSAARISEVTGTNKSLISRSLVKLEKAKYVEDFHGSTSRKPRLLQFTPAGRALHEQILEVALQRENDLRKGLSGDEVRELLRMLRVLLKNASELSGVED